MGSDWGMVVRGVLRGHRCHRFRPRTGERLQHNRSRGRALGGSGWFPATPETSRKCHVRQRLESPSDLAQVLAVLAPRTTVASRPFLTTHGAVLLFEVGVLVARPLPIALAAKHVARFHSISFDTRSSSTRLVAARISRIARQTPRVRAPAPFPRY